MTPLILCRATRLAVFVGALLLLSRPSAAQEPERVFEDLWGPQLRSVQKTPDKHDDLDLAQQILDSTQRVSYPPPVLAVALQRVIRIAATHPDGHGIVVAAARQLLEQRPAPQPLIDHEFISVLERVYRRAKGEERRAAATTLFQVLTSSAEARTEAGDLDEALALYQKAKPLVRYFDFGVEANVDEKIDKLTHRRSTTRRVDRLMRSFVNKPGDQALARRLALLLIVEANDLETGAGLAAQSGDDQLINVGRLMGRGLEDLGAADLIEVGDWLVVQHRQASDWGKVYVLSRALSCYQEAAERRKKNALSLKAAMGAKRVKALLLELDKYNTHAAMLRRLQVHSAGYNAGNSVRISLGDDVVVERGGAGPEDLPRRGVHLVAVRQGSEPEARLFDTYASHDQSRQFAETIAALPDGTFVVLATCDEPTSNFTELAQKAVRAVGGKIGLLGQPFRSSYICIGYKGLTAGRAIEMISSSKPVDYPPAAKQ